MVHKNTQFPLGKTKHLRYLRWQACGNIALAQGFLRFSGGHGGNIAVSRDFLRFLREAVARTGMFNEMNNSH